MVRKSPHDVALTKHWKNVDIHDTSTFTSRFLLITEGSIGAGLESSDTILVQRVGMKTCRLNLMQEMGRCDKKPTS